MAFISLSPRQEYQHILAKPTEARRLRAKGAKRIVAPSVALAPGEAAGFHIGTAGVLPGAEGWCAADAARPDVELLDHVRPLYPG